jgi:diguanylate cyclase (GGDEF)-like protein
MPIMNLTAALLLLLLVIAAAVVALLLVMWQRIGPSDAPAARSAEDAKKIDQIVQGYQDILSDVARRLGLQGKVIADAGALVSNAKTDMSADLKSELDLRLAEIIAKNNQLRQDLFLAQERLNAQHAELDRARAESRIDYLTQLPNRRAFEERAAEMHSNFERHQASYALAIFDIDHFKGFNDSHGHAAGDAMLRTVGKAASEIRRSADHLARIGGEEFALLLPHMDLGQSRQAAERYRKAINTTKLWIDGQQLNVAASIGIAVIQPGETFADLLLRADQALYSAKESGRNQVCVHDGSGAAPLATVGSSRGD